jgi:MFS transporter, UMF1 family
MKFLQYPRLVVISWALYDWASSPFSAIIQTFVFAAYFVKSVATNEIIGSAQWGVGASIAGVIVGVLGPIFGAAADLGGRRKVWLAFFTLLCIIPTALLWTIKPSPDYVWLALILVGIGTIGVEGAYIFYNGMLPDLAPPGQIGRWSGWGWGMGYAGGLAALILSLEAFVNTKSPWFGLDRAAAEPVRATFALTALWYAVFAIPLFLFTPDTPSKGKTFYQATIEGGRLVRKTILEVKRYRYLLRFFIAKLFYIDGLTTIFAFGGIYAASTLHMNEQQVLQYGIALNISAGIGAFLLAFFDDPIGGKKMILLSLTGLAIFGMLALFAKSQFQFWIFGLLFGIFVGPIQASSRSFLARISPPELLNEMFGFYMLSGKATAFFGPLFFSWITYQTESQRWGMSTVLLFFLIGGIILSTIPSNLEKQSRNK